MSNTQRELPISVVLVTYDSADVIGAALDSLGHGVEVAVVDNGSRDDTVKVARAAGVKVIVCDENKGFGTACNIGAAATTRPLLFFFNPDATVRDDTLARLATAMERHGDWIAANPRILSPSGEQFFRQATRLEPEIGRRRDRLPEADREIQVLSGSALLVHRRAFDTIGGFDEKIFLYCEDDDLSLRLTPLGKLGYVHDAVIEHIGGGSSPDSLAMVQFKAYHLMRSTRYAMAKHGVRHPRRARTALCLWRYGLATVTFNGREKAKYRGYLAALMES